MVDDQHNRIVRTVQSGVFDPDRRPFGEEFITRLVFDPSAITIIGPPAGLPVPEPGTALLLGLGLAGLAARGRR